MRVNHDYHRRGAVAYSPRTTYTARRSTAAARTPRYRSVHRAGRTGLTQEPYKSADRVFWVVDNGSSHRGQKAIDRLTDSSPTPSWSHPVHASWLNQVEIFFSIVQRKVYPPTDFDDLDVLVERLAAFETRYNQAAETVQVEVHHTDLADLMDRLDRPPGRRSAPTQTTRAALTPDELTGAPLRTAPRRRWRRGWRTRCRPATLHPPAHHRRRSAR